MNKEIEAKIRVESLEAIAERLGEVGGRFECTQAQADEYFTDAGEAMIKMDRGLRLRRQEVDGQEVFLLTYKGPRDKTMFKSREEIEVEVADGDAMRKLLLAMGLKVSVTVAKKRRLWRLGECVVCLDDVTRLGSFVEVEGPTEEAISEVLGELRLKGSDHISNSYSKMVRNSIAEQT